VTVVAEARRTTVWAEIKTGWGGLGGRTREWAPSTPVNAEHRPYGRCGADHPREATHIWVRFEGVVFGVSRPVGFVAVVGVPLLGEPQTVLALPVVTGLGQRLKRYPGP
jgi:hypothetical protein